MANQGEELSENLLESANPSGSNDEDQQALSQWDHQEELHIEESRENELRSQLEEELNPRRSLIHRSFILVNGITVTTALLLLVAEIMGFYVVSVGIVDAALRGYMILSCIIMILNEIELSSLVKDSRILHNWISRGVVYAFIGVLGLEQLEAMQTSEKRNFPHTKMALKFSTVVSFMIMSLGILYFVMGIFCLQILLGSLRAGYQERLTRARQTERVTNTFSDVL